MKRTKFKPMKDSPERTRLINNVIAHNSSLKELAKTWSNARLLANANPLDREELRKDLETQKK